MNIPSKFVFAYITTKNAGEARRIARKLVTARLAACANIIPKIESIYRWEGEINEDSETVVIAKTKKTLTKQFIAKVKSLHSYSCPCIVFLPIVGGNKDFLEWINKETDR